jgi:hypothetical protein
MRYVISVLLLTALIVGWQQPALAQHYVRDTVVAGMDLELRWPTQQVNAAQACIKIPAGAIGQGEGKVAPGTEIAITRISQSTSPSDWPRRFRINHRDVSGPERRLVFPPIFEFSADPPFTINDPTNYFTIGICAQYHQSDVNAIKDAHVARPSAAHRDSLDFLDKRTPCDLKCTPASMVSREGATSYLLRQLFAGSPFTATSLYAFPAEGGLGGGGGSLSPFGVVEK